MHRVDVRTYEGAPGEIVTVTTQTGNKGVVSVCLNGADLGSNAQFPLPLRPGDKIHWTVELRGKLGAWARVWTAVVDGGKDEDFLICQVHTPFPDHIYRCSVVQTSSSPQSRRPRVARSAATVKRKKVAKAVAKPSTRKPLNRKTAGRKPAAKRQIQKRAAKKVGRTSKKGGRS